nr:GAF domain-containing protein [Neisseria sp. HSC-16F19]
MHALTLTHGDKAETYRQLLPQLAALIADETDLTANLANISAVLKEAFGWLWVGFYRTDGDTLVLGPFQGPLACTRIPHGRGVCGQAWAQGETLVVADVNAHPDHIACSSLSQSEIVVPVFDRHGAVMLVLDVDADQLAVFDDTDAEYLQQLAVLIGEKHG